MKVLIRILATSLIVLSVACGGGGSSGGSGGAAGAAAAFPADGNYEGIGTFLTNVRVVDLNSNTPPVDADCVGDISIVVDNNASDVLVGNGGCNLPANFVSYTLVGGFIDDENFEGTITLVLNGRDNVLSFSGSRTGDVLNANFSGRTAATTRLVIDWDGSFDATRP